MDAQQTMMESATPYTNTDPKTQSTSRTPTVLYALLGVSCFVGTFFAGRYSMGAPGPASAAVTQKFLAPTPTTARTTTSLNAIARGPFRGKGKAPVAADENVFDVQDAAGIVEPTGFFDPLGLSKNIPAFRLKYFREAELKHGRVAMLAALGFLVAESFHPLFGGQIDTPSYLAFQQTPLETFWPGVVAALAVIESQAVKTFKDPRTFNANQKVADTRPESDFGFVWELKDDYKTGDLGFDPLNLKPSDPAELKDMQTKELQNGRLAMLGIAGMVAQELVDGKPIFGTAPVSAAEISQVAHEMATVLNTHALPM